MLAQRGWDSKACKKTAAKFIDSPMLAERVIENAIDFCATEGRITDSVYACPHFQETIRRALELEPPDKLYSPESFCKVTEQFVISLRGAPRVPRAGTGTLLDFKVSDECVSTVASAFAPQEVLASDSVPDFWYAMCANQDCGHYLPSRTKWCDIQRTPTHSIVVCEEARRFALDEVIVHDAKVMGPRRICALYAEFVKEMGIDIYAYEHVMHNSTVAKLPRPGARERALLSARMVNAAKTRYVQRNAAAPVEGPEKSPGEAAPSGQGERSFATGTRVNAAPALLLWIFMGQSRLCSPMGA